MSRQHCAPVVLRDDDVEIPTQLLLSASDKGVSEAELQNLVHRYPQCLPISEIDPLFSHPVPLCTELNTSAGSIDNVFVTPTGLPIIVECKLWRNPEGRREVVGQILDYAKELANWTCSDLQREIARRTGDVHNPIIDAVRRAGHDVNEIEFNDSLSKNLKLGRFLLIIVGDGIREGVEAISEYLRDHANLHFSFGLVELPIFQCSDGIRIISPRVLLRTKVIERHIINIPEGYQIVDAAEKSDLEDPSANSRKRFWEDFVNGLKLDDPEQKLPKPTNQGAIYVPMPVPGGTLWLTIYRIESENRAGIYVSYTRDSLGSRIVEVLLQDWEDIRSELGGTVQIDETDRNGRKLILDCHSTGNWANDVELKKMFSWLRNRTNDFVNVFRPRIKSIVADLEQA